MNEINKFDKSKLHYYLKGLQEHPKYIYSKDEANYLEQFIKNKYGE